MPLKNFKKEAAGGLPTEPSTEVSTFVTPAKKKAGRPKGTTKSKMTGKTVRDKILERFRIDEFLNLMDTDDRVRRYYYLELIPKLLPKLTEKEVEEKFGVSFIFGDRSEKMNTADKPKKVQREPMKLTLEAAPKPEGSE